MVVQNISKVTQLVRGTAGRNQTDPDYVLTLDNKKGT